MKNPLAPVKKLGKLVLNVLDKAGKLKLRDKKCLKGRHDWTESHNTQIGAHSGYGCRDCGEWRGIEESKK